MAQPVAVVELGPVFGGGITSTNIWPIYTPDSSLLVRGVSDSNTIRAKHRNRPRSPKPDD